MSNEEFKKQAADRAAENVESGMIVGLGAGSTAIWALRRIAERLKAGDLRDILGIPCAQKVDVEARKLEIPLTTLDEHPVIDVTIDGADEVDPQLDVIKGGGGALLREKIVAQATRREIIVVDESKLSPALGTHWALPVEVIPFGYGSQKAFLESLGAKVNMRLKADGTPFVTDQGNFILDSNFGAMRNPPELSAKLKARTGIVEHGLFIGMAAEVIVAGANGIRQIKRS